MKSNDIRKKPKHINKIYVLGRAYNIGLYALVEFNRHALLFYKFSKYEFTRNKKAIYKVF